MHMYTYTSLHINIDFIKFISTLFLYLVLGIKSSALYMLSTYSTTELYYQPLIYIIYA
jgi:hypothetical protein